MKLAVQTHNRNRRRSAFTLMEVLVVVAILVVLAGIGVMVFRYLDESKDKIAKMGAKKLEQAAVAYKLNNQNYPETLEILAQPSADGKAAYVEEKDLYDPWNRPYQYDPNQLSRTGMPLISSQGANPGASPPISNWP